jgi:hypothetical protein
MGNAWESSKQMIYSVPPTRSVFHYYPLLSLLLHSHRSETLKILHKSPSDPCSGKVFVKCYIRKPKAIRQKRSLEMFLSVTRVRVPGVHFFILEVFARCQPQTVPVITIKHSRLLAQRQTSVFSAFKGVRVLHSERDLSDKSALHGILIRMIEM